MELFDFVQIIYSIKFDEKPPYKKLIKILETIFNKKGRELDFLYDFINYEKKKDQEVPAKMSKVYGQHKLIQKKLQQIFL